MPGYVRNRVCETSTTTGTGSYTLAGAVTGFQSFDNSGVGSITDVYYLAEDVDGNGVPTGDWEVGSGNLSAPTTLDRKLIINSSNHDSAVSWLAGTRRIHLTAPATQIGFLGGQYTRTTNLTAQNFTTSTAIAWDNNPFDTEPVNRLHNNAVTNTRITIPTGYTGSFVRLRAQVSLTNLIANDWVELNIRPNGSGSIGRATHSSANTSPFYAVLGNLYQVTDTDYFELLVQTATDTSVDLLSAQSFFEIEFLQ